MLSAAQYAALLENLAIMKWSSTYCEAFFVHQNFKNHIMKMIISISYKIKRKTKKTLIIKETHLDKKSTPTFF